MVEYKKTTGDSPCPQERNPSPCNDITKSPAETEAIGQDLGRPPVPRNRGGLHRRPGRRARPPSSGAWPGVWGFPSRVTSPTFTIVNEYEGARLPLFHFDMYRLHGRRRPVRHRLGGLSSAGAAICAVEWSETIREALDEDDHLCGPSAGGQGEQERILTLHGPGLPEEQEETAMKILALEILCRGGLCGPVPG